MIIGTSFYSFTTDVKPFDCRCIYDSDNTAETGLYSIDPGDGMGQFTVYCDMGLNPGSTGDRGWTIIQRRLDDTQSFEKEWKSYKNGFGSLYGNFWLGLEKIRRITTSTTTYELYIGMGDHYASQDTKYARYGSFLVNSESTNYKLGVSSYYSASTAADSLLVHDDEPFSTSDADNDASSTNCAVDNKGGWWYNTNCHDANLNGKWYLNGQLAVPSVPDGIIWQHWTGDQYSLKEVIMAIRSDSACD